MSINRQVTSPLNVPRTNRNHALTVLTSGPAGKFWPLAAVPLLREDSASGSVNIAFEMQETAEILMNPVNVVVRAFLVPFLAFERFEGSMDQFNRSYMGQPKTVGGAVTPFFEFQNYGGHTANAVYTAMGLHSKETDGVNTAYLEAYNLIWNWLAKNRSPDITERPRLDKTLAPAFWPSSRFAHIVPDFDQAVIDGEVALSLVDGSGKIPVRGLFTEQGQLERSGTWKRTLDGTGFAQPGLNLRPVGAREWGDAVVGTVASVYAELKDGGIAMSLANLDMARRTQAFAKLREQYTGHDDDWIIDMLMSGLTIPDQALKQPMLLAQTQTRFGMAKRYATDSGNLSESAVSGASMARLSFRVPKLHTGGVIMIVAEITPEQLFERQRDPFFNILQTATAMGVSANPVEALPEYIRDTLDPEKVVAVQNGYIDTDHAQPTGTFGYAPLHHEWNQLAPKVGGKFFRPTANTGFDEDRQRLWAVETVNPQLAEDFYICKSIHQKPFLDTVSDPFEATMLGNVVINGNTVFGGALVEATNNYDAVMEKAPTDRIVKEA